MNESKENQVNLVAALIVDFLENSTRARPMSKCELERKLQVHLARSVPRTTFELAISKLSLEGRITKESFFSLRLPVRPVDPAIIRQVRSSLKELKVTGSKELQAHVRQHVDCTRDEMFFALHHLRLRGEVRSSSNPTFSLKDPEDS